MFSTSLKTIIWSLFILWPYALYSQNQEDTEEPASILPQDTDQTTEDDHWQSITPQSQVARIATISVEEVVEPPSGYNYAAFEAEDPFAPPDFRNQALQQRSAALSGGVAGGALQPPPKGTEIPIISPLQKFPLQQLSLKGIWILEDGRKKALIMTPDAQGVIVTIGDPLSAGKIIDITKHSLIARQYRIRADGAREFQDETIYMGPKPMQTSGSIFLPPGKPPVFSTESSDTETLNPQLSEQEETDPPITTEPDQEEP